VAKVRAYFEYGVRRVWVILPEERQVYVYESPTQVHILAVTDTLSGGDLFPGFTLPLASLFARGAASPSP
jgi:Uma2 family endonuclease